jgi:HlyD family secretion protein
VLAFPNETFHGIVSQVRVNPTTVANVVTYDVVVLVDNAAGKLLPGMTANASISVAQVKNALVAPLQALSYRPAGGTRSHRPAQANGPSGSPWGQTGSGSSGAVVSGTRGVVFVLQHGKPHAVPVNIQLVSGMQAAIVPLRGSLRAGDPLVTGDSAAHTQRSAAATPAGPGPGLGRMIR